jgi:sarcosine oxidase / L-pipecolate oxidase
LLANWNNLKGKAGDEEYLRKISPKWVEKYHIIDKINHGNTNGFIDINAGITIADKVIKSSKALLIFSIRC